MVKQYAPDLLYGGINNPSPPPPPISPFNKFDNVFKDNCYTTVMTCICEVNSSPFP